jgi:hypothetical protein
MRWFNSIKKWWANFRNQSYLVVEIKVIDTQAGPQVQVFSDYNEIFVAHCQELGIDTKDEADMLRNFIVSAIIPEEEDDDEY